MLRQEMRDAVVNRVRELCVVAERKFGRSFDLPVMHFDIGGTKGGCHRRGILHFNPTLLEENFDHYLHQIVGHEFAHYVQRILYPFSKAHGWEWRNCMRMLGLNPIRCHSYDTSNCIKRVHRKYTLRCDCSEHKVTIRVLSKIREGQTYKCLKCKGKVIEKNS
jgi:predicted SprT family Zn-dependent metalloprotease